jgi:uncharacterized protein YcbK (DUF882 family)
MTYQIKHFQPKEFFCPCCARGNVAVALVFWLDVLRRAVGAPFVVNSGFRCARRNAAVDGSASSRHLIGCAADIAKPAGVAYSAFSGIVRRVSENWEIVDYPERNFIHIGVARVEQSKTWDGKKVITL